MDSKAARNYEEEAIHKAEKLSGAAGEPVIVRIGNELYVQCPRCKGAGTEERRLALGLGRRRAVRRIWACRFCEGKANLPYEYWQRYKDAKPGQRF
jgi:hypothetical protein